MKFTEEKISPSDINPIDIVRAIWMIDYKINIKFSDGTEKTINFKPFLSNSLHPSIRKYLDKKMFKGFEIIDGNLNWDDYNLIFPVSDLHEGRI